jgi:signal peptidase II
MSRLGGPLSTLALVTTTVVVVDQGLKTAVRSALAVCTSDLCMGHGLPASLITIDGRNSASAFGLLPGATVPVLIVAALPILLYQTRIAIASTGGASMVGLVLGGLIGNLADRAIFGSVTDFIVLGPVVANPADFALAVGGVGLAIVTWRSTRPRPRQRVSGDAPRPVRPETSTTR